MSDFLDTLMNIEVFAFIAALVWLYFREPPDQEEPPDTNARPDPENAQSDGAN